MSFQWHYLRWIENLKSLPAIITFDLIWGSEAAIKKKKKKFPYLFCDFEKKERNPVGVGKKKRVKLRNGGGWLWRCYGGYSASARGVWHAQSNRCCGQNGQLALKSQLVGSVYKQYQLLASRGFEARFSLINRVSKTRFPCSDLAYVAHLEIESLRLDL